MKKMGQKLKFLGLKHAMNEKDGTSHGINRLSQRPDIQALVTVGAMIQSMGHPPSVVVHALVYVFLLGNCEQP